MSVILERGRALYDILATDDVAALAALLSPDFVGELTAGLPNDLGRRYVGRDAMFAEAWGPLNETYAIVPTPDSLYDGGGVLIAKGHYVGTARATGRPMRAAFAHFWPFDGERFTGVVQVTDSGAWRDAIA